MQFFQFVRQDRQNSYREMKVNDEIKYISPTQRLWQEENARKADFL